MFDRWRFHSPLSAFSFQPPRSESNVSQDSQAIPLKAVSFLCRDTFRSADGILDKFLSRHCFSKDFINYIDAAERATALPYVVPEKALKATSFEDFAYGYHIAKTLNEGAAFNSRLGLEAIYALAKHDSEILAELIRAPLRVSGSDLDQVLTSAVRARFKHLKFASCHAEEKLVKLDQAIEVARLLFFLDYRGDKIARVSSDLKYVVRAMNSSSCAIDRGARNGSNKIDSEIVAFEVHELSKRAIEGSEFKQKSKLNGDNAQMIEAASLDALYFSPELLGNLYPISQIQPGIVRGVVFFHLCKQLSNIEPAYLAYVMEASAKNVELHEYMARLTPRLRKLGVLSLELAYRMVKAGFGV